MPLLAVSECLLLVPTVRDVEQHDRVGCGITGLEIAHRHPLRPAGESVAVEHEHVSVALSGPEHLHARPGAGGAAAFVSPVDRGSQQDAVGNCLLDALQQPC